MVSVGCRIFFPSTSVENTHQPSRVLCSKICFPWGHAGLPSQSSLFVSWRTLSHRIHHKISQSPSILVARSVPIKGPRRTAINHLFVNWRILVPSASITKTSIELSRIASKTTCFPLGTTQGTSRFHRCLLTGAR